MKSRISFLLVALSLAITVNATNPFQLVTFADSLNYATGMLMYSSLRESMQQKYAKKSKKALASYAKGFEKVYNAKKDTSEYITLLGYWAGGTLVDESSKDCFFGNSALRTKKDLIIDGFRVGVSGAYFPMSESECNEFIGQIVVSPYFGEEKPKDISVAMVDSFNLCFGYLAGFQTRRDMLLGDTASDDIKAFMQGFDKGLKLRNPSRRELEGMESAFLLSQQLEKTPHFDGFEMLPISYELIGQGIVDAFSGDNCLMDEKVAMHYVDSVAKVYTERRNAVLKATADSFLVENAKHPEVVVTASGLQYEVITDAEGPKPADTDTIAANYLGSFIDGTVFENDEYFEFIPSYVISGLKEGIQLMSKGAKYRFFVPYNLAYGEKGCNDIPPYSVLVFEVELVDFRPAKHDF